MSNSLVIEIVDRLRSDATLLARVKSDPQVALSDLGLPPAMRHALTANSPTTLRKLQSPDDEGTWAGRPTEGGQCTQAGCYTHEGNCPSVYACSGSPGCR
jgi:hypothetical protein